MVCVIALAGMVGGVCAVILATLMTDAPWFVLAMLYPAFGSMAALLAAVVAFHAGGRARAAGPGPKVAGVRSA